jgi:hypothetical protein
MILPPVVDRAESAAFKAGNNAGSGFLIWENRVGSWFKSDTMTALQTCQDSFALWIRNWMTHFEA